MKKKLLIILPLFLFSCTSESPISKEDCLTKIDKSLEIYKDYEKLSKDFVVIRNVVDNKNEIKSSEQFAYDSEHKLFYQYKLETKTKTWSYFEDNTLIHLIQTADNKSEKTETVEIVGDNYFKKYFSDYLTIKVTNIKNGINDSGITEPSFKASSQGNFSITFKFSTVYDYNFKFENYLLKSAVSNEYDSEKLLKEKTELKVEYKKFTTSVNKKDFE